MRYLIIGVVLLSGIAATTYLQADFLRQRPTVLKLGPVPHAGLIKAFAGEHRASLALQSVTRVMFYFGSFFDPNEKRLQKYPEYFSMFKHLEHAVKIDPYNMDAYYFAQAAFTWEVGHAKDVNTMLDYGMRYRTWDYWLPFYAGFNAAYFLKDYDAAARYMQVAAEMSKNTLFTTLAARYFHEAGQAGLGLVFLETMAQGAQTERVKDIYQRRIEALNAVRQIEAAIKTFIDSYNTRPAELGDLVDSGLLDNLPQDPYGGEFYLDEKGRVRTTSEFAIMSEESDASTETLELDDKLKQDKDRP